MPMKQRKGTNIILVTLMSLAHQATLADTEIYVEIAKQCVTPEIMQSYKNIAECCSAYLSDRLDNLRCSAVATDLTKKIKEPQLQTNESPDNKETIWPQ